MPNQNNSDRIARLKGRRLFQSPHTTSAGQQPPPKDTSILVHDCFDQRGGENQPDCACDRRIGRLDAAALIKAGKADALRIVRNGQGEIRRNAIVLTRDYVSQRWEGRKVDPKKILSATLKPALLLSFKNGILRDKHGNAFVLEVDNTDSKYWHTVLCALGLGANAGIYLKQAEVSKGLPVSLTTLDNFTLAPHQTFDDLDPEINAVLAGEISQRKEENRRRRRRVKPRGNGRDSDEKTGEAHWATGQMTSNASPSNERPADSRTKPKGADRANSAAAHLNDDMRSSVGVDVAKSFVSE